MTNTETVNTPQKFGHPSGLFYLFFAELWERFSFYGMRALLTLYMIKHLKYVDSEAYSIYAAYGALVYATPLIGGILADKLLGYRFSIILGGILMALGHFTLAIENEYFFYGALALLVIGNGFFKPNISSLLSVLYEQEDKRRDAGFTIFYLGVNLGAFLAPLACGYLGETYGWHYGFGLAGIGMLVGLVFFWEGVKRNVFTDKGLPPSKENLTKKTFGISKASLVVLVALTLVPFIGFLINRNDFLDNYFVWITSFAIGIYLLYVFLDVGRTARKRLLVVVYFTVLATLFWAVFEQAGSSLTTFADRNVNLVSISASQTNSINPFYIMVLAIPFSIIWTYLSRNKINPNTPVKFGLGLLMLGFGFLIFGYSANFADEFAKTPMFYLFLGYFVLTVGELFLSPIGLSKVTELSPGKYISFMLGVWFLSSFYGHVFAGKIAKLTVSDKGRAFFENNFFQKSTEIITGMTGEMATASGESFEKLFNYVSVFSIFGVIACIIGVLALFLSPFVKKLMHGVD